MTPREATHRLHHDGALCGDDAPTVSPHDAVVTCPTCLAILEAAQRRRRTLVRRSLVLIGKLANA